MISGSTSAGRPGPLAAGSRLLASVPALHTAAALTLVALVLDLVRIGSRSIVHDESTSILFALGSFGSLVRVVTGGDPNMGLYYVLLSAWVRIFGESETAVRSMSALSGALAVGAIYLLGSRLFGRTAGLAAGVLLALNGFMVRYAQVARAYSLLVLLVTLSSYFFVVELQQSRRRTRIAYVLMSVFTVYAHYFAVYVLLAQAITLVAMRRRAALTRQWLGVAWAIVLLCLPAVIIAFRSGAGRLGWIDPPMLTDIGLVFTDLGGGSQLLVVMLLASGAYATMAAIRKRRSWAYGFVAVWLVVPVVLSFGASLMQPMFLSNYLIICLPALVLFGVSAIPEIRRHVLAAALAATLVWLSATGLADFYSRDRGEHWREATQFVLSSSHPEDGIVFFPDHARKPFDYYQRRGVGFGPANIQRERPGKTQRIWLLIRESDVRLGFNELETLRSSLTERYRFADQRRFQRVAIELYVLR